MTMPNFFVIGSMKCGTTSLYYNLQQHPQVYMSPVKSPDFFYTEDGKWEYNGAGDIENSNRWAKQKKASTLEEYKALFRGVTDEIAIGDASPAHLYSPEAPGLIKRHVPEAKLIAVLRNPADRAYSAYNFARQLLLEPLDDFSQALREEEERKRNDWDWLYHYRSFGFYATQLERYYEKFDREQIRVFLYEDQKDDPIGFTQEVFRFLGVDDTFVPDTSWKFNVGGIPKNRALHRLITRPNPLKTGFKKVLPAGWTRQMYERVKGMNLTKTPPLREEDRRELIEGYRQEILRLQDLIQRDLSGWLQTEGSYAPKGQRVLSS